MLCRVSYAKYIGEGLTLLAPLVTKTEFLLTLSV